MIHQAMKGQCVITAGSYEEIIADGTKTTKVIGDNFEIIMRDSNVYIGGKSI